MGREQRMREEIERQTRERLNLQRKHLYDRYGHQVQVGDLVSLVGGFHGDWRVVEIETPSGIVGAVDLPPNTVRVRIMAVQDFVLPDASIIGDLLLAHHPTDEERKALDTAQKLVTES